MHAHTHITGSSYTDSTHTGNSYRYTDSTHTPT